MKKSLCLFLTALFALAVLSACGCDGGATADLVFVSNLDATVVKVMVDFTGRISGARRADSCPLNQGESFGFEAGEYPVTLAVYNQTSEERSGQRELASITINSAPPEGERWYVVARDSGCGIELTFDVRWPEGV